MGAGDGDAVLEAHQLGEHLRARHHRDVTLARGDHLGVVGLHRGGHHDHVGGVHVGGIMAAHDARTHLLQAPGRGVVAEVRAAHTVTLVGQHLGDAAHARTADADEVDVSDLVFHFASPPASSAHTCATATAASGLASARACSAMFSKRPRSRLERMPARRSGESSVCGSR